MEAVGGVLIKVNFWCYFIKWFFILNFYTKDFLNSRTLKRGKTPQIVFRLLFFVLFFCTSCVFLWENFPLCEDKKKAQRRKWVWRKKLKSLNFIYEKSFCEEASAKSPTYLFLMSDQLEAFKRTWKIVYPFFITNLTLKNYSRNLLNFNRSICCADSAVT